MTRKWRRRFCHQVCWPLVIAGSLSACGGGVGEVALTEIIAAVAVVTPLGGQWRVATTDEQLDFNLNPADEVLFESTLAVTAKLETRTDVCGAGFGTPSPGAPASLDLEGTLTNGELVLRPAGAPKTTSCLEGKFTDFLTLEATPTGRPTLLYKNDRVEVGLQLGLWVSDGGGQVKLKFEGPNILENKIVEPVSGCDVSGPVVIKFDGEMTIDDAQPDAKPFIPELLSDPTGIQLFTQVVFVDGATLTLSNAGGQAVTLRRTRDTTTTCPP